MATWSGPISLKGVKGDSVPQTLPNDLTPNSVAIAPVSGDTAASGLTQRNASGNTVLSSDASGNVACAGTLAAAGALSAASAAISGNETIGGNLSVTGTLTAGALTASGTNIGGNQTVQGNDTIQGALSVAGKTTLGGDLTATSGNTNLAATNVTSLTASGTVSAAAVVCQGTFTGNGDANIGGKLTVQKNSVFQSTAQTVGLLTCSGGMSSPSAGISVVGGTTTDSLVATGNTSLQGTVSTGAVTASALTTTGNLRSNGNLSCTNGTTTLGGPTNVSGAATLSSTLSVSGATTLAALTASSSSISGNETVGGTLGVTGATSVAAVTATGTVTAPNVTLTSGGGGKLTFADGTTQATSATAASASAGRTEVDLGGYYNTNTNTSYWTLQRVHFNATSGGTTPGGMELLKKMPFAGSITGWSMEQYVSNGTNTFQICKNRTSGSLNNIVTVTAGNATVSGFPGNPFSGTFTKGQYAFVAGDVLSGVVSFGSGSSTNCHLTLYVEWT